LPKIVFTGTVFSGIANGKKFVDLPWVKRQIEEKLGFSPFSGTLNLHLNEESEEKKILLENTEGIMIEPQVGYCAGVLFKVCIGALECAVVFPKVPSYPSDVLEIIAPVCLREHLKLKDGSLVSVSVNV
jgi:riboflavin kinase, archaea type